MREISATELAKAVGKLIIMASCKLPKSVTTALEVARLHEPSKVAGEILGKLLENAQIAATEAWPICQEIGQVVVFVDLGQEVQIVGGDFNAAIQTGVAYGHKVGSLKKSVLAEPLFEREEECATDAIIHLRMVEGDKVHLLLGLKGACAENSSYFRVLDPSYGLLGVREKVLEAIRAISAQVCAPWVIGVGIGGNTEACCLLAKRAALRSVGSANQHPKYHALERDLLDAINQSGIGPEGFGGSTTALAVNVEWGPTHMESLPVAVNINCHAARSAQMIL
ncbi:MAG: fumarate hydratase [Desulfovibrionaceae bacterium]|nr:fumarate hydratase [Desulfovibrionaceae bacterium]